VAGPWVFTAKDFQGSTLHIVLNENLGGTCIAISMEQRCSACRTWTVAGLGVTAIKPSHSSFLEIQVLLIRHQIDIILEGPKTCEIPETTASKRSYCF
jgi:hypothetical protein